MGFDCTKCKFYKGINNDFIGFCEVCEAGYCVLCRHKNYDSCDKLEPMQDDIIPSEKQVS